jgi:hypothetical protein
MDNTEFMPWKHNLHKKYEINYGSIMENHNSIIFRIKIMEIMEKHNFHKTYGKLWKSIIP